MSKKTHDTGKVTVASGSKGPSKAEAWTISKGGKRITVTTSSSSARAMDEAIKKYSGALKSLANK
jgi:hypothetical protein